jgi:Zn-dependent peptidase ImmA (M78 family)
VGNTIKILEMNKETVIVACGFQSFCIHNFMDPLKKNFRYFKEDLRRTRKLDIDKLIILVRNYDLTMVSTRHYNEPIKLKEATYYVP